MCVISVEQVKGRIHALMNWWTTDLWSPSMLDASHTKLEHSLVYAARSIYIVAAAFRAERIKLRAALLTYTTLLSLVPAVVVAFTIFTAFAGLEDVEASLKRLVASSIASASRDTVIEYVDRFVDQAGAVGGFGVVLLLYTVISLIGNIERALNDIWGLRRDRRLIQRFQVYWPLVTIGPILVGLSLSLTAAAETSETVKSIVILTPIFDLAFTVLPIVLTWVFLTLLYMFLPNTRVPLRAAIVGGVVAGTMWEAAKRLYAVYAGISLESPSVYGSLAAVPLFVLWIYVSWVIALTGATLTFAVQNARTYEPENENAKRSQRDRELLAARLLVAVSDAFDRGAGPIPAQRLVDGLSVSPRFARRILQELVETGLLVETMQREGDDSAYVPGRPLHTLSIADVVKTMRGSEKKNDLLITGDDALGKRVCQSLLSAETAVEDSLGRTTLAEMLAQTRSEEAALRLSGPAQT